MSSEYAAAGKTASEAWIDPCREEALCDDDCDVFGPFSISRDVAKGGGIRVEVFHSMLTYKVTGPPDLLKWQLERSGALVSEISPLTHITMTPEARTIMGIPHDAVKYAFMYPPLSTDRHAPNPESMPGPRTLLANGGFVYFTKTKKVTRINALTTTGPTILHFDGPHRLDTKMTNILSSQSLMKPVLGCLSPSPSTRCFAWLPAAAQVNPPLASGGFFFTYDDWSRNRYYRLLPPDREAPDVECVTPRSARKLSRVFSTFKLFKALEEIGKGAYGKVYKGVRQDTGEHVAMKVVPLKEGCDVEKIQKEFLTMRGLSHDNIVEIFAFYRTAKRAVIVMELVPFGSLETLIKSFGQGLPLVLLVRLLRQVVNGVEYLHSMNTIHGDLKPANILCTSDGKIKLADFGGARSLAQMDSGSAVHHTPVYCSPEALRGNFSTASDVWAVGCIALEMHTGQHPWKHAHDVGVGLETIMYNYIPKVDHPFPVECPAMLLEVLTGCMHRDIKERMELSRLLHAELFHASDEDLMKCDFEEGDDGEDGMPPRIPTGAFPDMETELEAVLAGDGIKTASNWSTVNSTDVVERVMEQIKSRVLETPGLVHAKPYILDAVSKAVLEIALYPSKNKSFETEHSHSDHSEMQSINILESSEESFIETPQSSHTALSRHLDGKSFF